jgi:hypothetical protein
MNCLNMKPSLRGQSTFHATEYLPQDIVALSKEKKCGLKYVMQTLQIKRTEPFLTPPLNS